jgi:predicted DNA-binding transcriptional regulator AlpA
MPVDNAIREDALTPDDLTALYGWSRTSQQRAEANGTMPPCYRIGRRRYYRRSVVEAWIAEQVERELIKPAGGDEQ